MRASSKDWLQKQLNDPYVRQAQKDGYRSRAAYKLEQIDQQVRLIRPGQVVVDLGAAPGAWSQYVRAKLLRRESGVAPWIDGRVIAIDLLQIEMIPGVELIQGDCRDPMVLEQLAKSLKKRKADLVLSDMAPNLSGVAAADSARIEQLGEVTLALAERFLKQGGDLLVKCFHHAGHARVLEQYRRRFRQVKALKPLASRSSSAEVFILARQLCAASVEPTVGREAMDQI